ncbi:hypothetical protein [Variovorax saccharolyticus]|uniref:hypothetical protein n=1 Tax=Variovorax saccharolyticus TaxID=3053516 RepID=UPI0025771403|nr:hypothetical protein [Variovorax sp. J31P216]MDM0028402.1 hypothetical protein [Variovorax sp. J31P216]
MKSNNNKIPGHQKMLCFSRTLPFLLALALGGCAMNPGNPGGAHLAARDLAGISLGMTTQEARAAMQARYAGIPLKLSVYRAQGAQPESPAMLSGTIRGSENGETLTVKFGETTGRVVAILQEGWKTSGFNTQAFLAEAEAKYGATTSREHKTGYSRGFSSFGLPEPRCVNRSRPENFQFPLPSASACGDSVNLWLYNYVGRPNSGLESNYNIYLVDNAAAAREASRDPKLVSEAQAEFARQAAGPKSVADPSAPAAANGKRSPQSASKSAAPPMELQPIVKIIMKGSGEEDALIGRDVAFKAKAPDKTGFMDVDRKKGIFAQCLSGTGKYATGKVLGKFAGSEAYDDPAALLVKFRDCRAG